MLPSRLFFQLEPAQGLSVGLWEQVVPIQPLVGLAKPAALPASVTWSLLTMLQWAWPTVSQTRNRDVPGFDQGCPTMKPQTSVFTGHWVPDISTTGFVTVLLGLQRTRRGPDIKPEQGHMCLERELLGPEASS